MSAAAETPGADDIASLRLKVDSYRAGNTQLLEALMDMVWQFVGIDDRDGVFSHTCMAAEEGALRVLIAAGVAEEAEPGKNAYRLLWDRLEQRKPERQTWAQAVRECVADPAEVERLLALGDDAASNDVHAAVTGPTP